MGIWNVCSASIKSSIKRKLAWCCWLHLRKNDNSITLSFGSCDESPKIVQSLSNKNFWRSILFCDPSNLVHLKLFVLVYVSLPPWLGSIQNQYLWKVIFITPDFFCWTYSFFVEYNVTFRILFLGCLYIWDTVKNGDLIKTRTIIKDCF